LVAGVGDSEETIGRFPENADALVALKSVANRANGADVSCLDACVWTRLKSHRAGKRECSSFGGDALARASREALLLEAGGAHLQRRHAHHVEAVIGRALGRAARSWRHSSSNEAAISLKSSVRAAESHSA